MYHYILIRREADWNSLQRKSLKEMRCCGQTFHVRDREAKVSTQATVCGSRVWVDVSARIDGAELDLAQTTLASLLTQMLQD